MQENYSSQKETGGHKELNLRAAYCIEHPAN